MSDQYPYQIKENVGSTNQAGNSGNGNAGAYQNNNQGNGNTGAYQINESGSGSYQNSGTTGYTPNSAAQNQGVPNQSSNKNLAKTILIIVAVLVFVYIVITVIGVIGVRQLQQENQRKAQEQYEQYEEFKQRTNEQFQESIRRMNEKNK